MNTITQNTEYELVEKKSRFIANLIYVDSREIAEEKIKELKKKYHDARHNCYAYRILEKDTVYEKSSDDGEPSGTAGAPMLNLLQKSELCNCLVVVTRYFGGILLGTGGLVRAYSGATKGGIENAKNSQIINGVEYKIKSDYPSFQSLKYYFDKKDVLIYEEEYDENVNFKVDLNEEQENNFLQDIEKKNLNIIGYERIKEKYIIR